LEAYIEDFADLRIAIDRLRNPKDEVISGKELRKLLPLTSNTRNRLKETSAASIKRRLAGFLIKSKMTSLNTLNHIRFSKVNLPD